jgi:hypothetical protein
MWRSREVAWEDLSFMDRPLEPESGFDTLAMAMLLQHVERCPQDQEAKQFLLDLSSNLNSHKPTSTVKELFMFTLNSANINDVDTIEAIFSEVIPPELRDDVAQGMIFSRIGRWYGNAVNLLRNPDSPSVQDWEMAQADAEQAIAFYSSFTMKPIDFAKAVTWYANNNRPPVALSSEDHIANVMRFNGVSKEVAIQQIEAAKARKMAQGEERNKTAQQHLQELVNQLKASVEAMSPIGFESTAQEVDSLLTTAIRRANQAIDRAAQQIAGIPDPEIQEYFKANQLLIEAGKAKVKGLWFECQRVLQEAQNSGYPPVEGGVH